MDGWKQADLTISSIQLFTVAVLSYSHRLKYPGEQLPFHVRPKRVRAHRTQESQIVVEGEGVTGFRARGCGKNRAESLRSARGVYIHGFAKLAS
jgi:hypothetical protein